MNPLFPHLLFFGCCALVGIFAAVLVMMPDEPRRKSQRRQRTSEVTNISGWKA